MRHVISVLLQNEAGALTRLTALFSSRGYNIDSLNVAPTNDPTVSRLTVVSSGSDVTMAQIASQMGKLVDVVSIYDMTLGEHYERELLLIKMTVATGEYDAVMADAEAAGARVLDDSQQNCALELTARPAEIDAFVAACERRAEIRAVIRSGSVAAMKGDQIHAHPLPESLDTAR
ncbi:MAG: acetolactate synthase small subunit [Pseudomonadota bacterium]